MGGIVQDFCVVRDCTPKARVARLCSGLGVVVSASLIVVFWRMIPMAQAPLRPPAFDHHCWIALF